MAESEPIQNIEARLQLYALDARARGAIKQLWPAIESQLEKAVDEILDAAAKLPNIAKAIAQHRTLIKNLEMAHLKALMNGNLDGHYFESCRKTVEQEAALGLDARFRSTAGSYFFRQALDALGHK